MKMLEGLQWKGKKVLLRVDFNVPFKNGQITDFGRVEAHRPTIDYLLEQGALITLVSHFGRPKGKVVAEMSFAQMIHQITAHLNMPITFVPDCVGEIVEKALAGQKQGELLLLENSRFHPEEEKNDPQFAQLMARPFDCFVMDAFSAAHRGNASTEGVVHFLPSACGRLLQKEIKALDVVAKAPNKPYAVILGGAKVSDKIGVIDHLMTMADKILIGGGMAFTFLAAQGHNVGKSLLDQDHLEYAKTVLENAQQKGIEVLLPIDLVASPSIEAPDQSRTVDGVDLDDLLMGLDIGPATATRFAAALDGCRTVLWNGPMGVFEQPVWASGSRAICEKLAQLTEQGSLTVVGGGDTASAVRHLGFEGKLSHLSTGGGASLEYCEGKELPGIVALN